MLQYLNDSFRRTRRYGAVIADKYLFEIFGIHTVDILFRRYQAAYLNLNYLLWKRSENEYAVDIGIIIEPGQAFPEYFMADISRMRDDFGIYTDISAHFKDALFISEIVRTLTRAKYRKLRSSAAAAFECSRAL